VDLSRALFSTIARYIHILCIYSYFYVCFIFVRYAFKLCRPYLGHLKVGLHCSFGAPCLIEFYLFLQANKMTDRTHRRGVHAHVCMRVMVGWLQAAHHCLVAVEARA